tara:strand:- start:882 stop:1055 length:174 start_codon:yes stop_codon:yes gene_type:complete
MTDDDKQKGWIDQLLMNQLIRILTDFILGILKLFSTDKNITKPKRPLKDLLDRWFKK